MTIEKMTPTDSKISIWGEPANINYYLNTELVPDSVGGVTNVQTTVKAHTRRQYPGDPSSINVSGHSRTYMVDPGRKVGNALPGEPFILDDGIEKRQFTFVGDVIDLHAFLVGDMKAATKLYTTGARYVIPKST